jgi:hypothetical protein
MNDNLRSGNVLEMPKIGRRKGIAKLTKNYFAMLAHVIIESKFDDGEHFDENDLPLVRDLDRTEGRIGATIMAAQFFAAMLRTRAAMEEDKGPGSFMAFVADAIQRVENFDKEHFGKGKVVLPGKYKLDLRKIEQNYATAIFTALRIEMNGIDAPEEWDFWADVFRGMADADPSGVVLRAAGLVALDHLPHLQQAITYHMK